MLYVALAALGVAALAVVVFGNLLRIERRQSARREDLLINQVCNLAGRPWQQAPASIPFVMEELPELVMSPEQLPDY